MTLEWVEPAELVTPRRLDLAVKWRFLRHLKQADDRDSERVYRWHIERRTKGREPGSWKQTTDQYVTACGTLLASMMDRGFDSRSPVRVGSNGLLMGGAHRIACSLLLGERVRVLHDERPGKAAPWGRDWFAMHCCPEADLARIERDYERMLDEARDRRLAS